MVPRKRRPITLTLQGGGSLGAFAWGALDRLLDEQSLEFAVVSGASAGAMNAALLVTGLASPGSEAERRAEARRLLETFWRRVAVAAGSLDAPGGEFFHLLNGFMAPMTAALRHRARNLYPASMKALNLTRLRGLLEGLVDPAAFARPGVPRLVVSATSVRTGEARLFSGGEVTLDVLLASSCLPELFPTIDIDGEPYWDGGFAANPPLRALIEAGAPLDIVIVRTSPVERPAPPVGHAGIQHRAAEIAFDQPLRHELRNMAVAQKLLAELPDAPGVLGRLRDARLHMIGAEEEFRALDGVRDPTWGFVQEMRDTGHQAADEWVASNLSALGKRSSLDLSALAAPGGGLDITAEAEPEATADAPADSLFDRLRTLFHPSPPPG